MIIKRHALDKLSSIYKTKYEYAEDYKLWSELATTGNFYNIQESLLQYRLHKNQIGSNKQAAQRKVHSSVSKENLETIEINLPHDEIHHLLWPEEKTISRAQYMNKMQKMIKNISSKNKMSTPLLRRLLKLTVKNLLA
ncbi:hypothetical protein D3C80_1321890 [compost metagenome]